MDIDKPHIVMCKPTHFGVQYEINPWMQGQIGFADNVIAQQQWNRLHEILSNLTSVKVIEGATALPDMCFVANAGLVINNQFVPSRFRFSQRMPEAPLFTEWFNQAGYEIVELDGEDTFEGEGDTLLATSEGNQPSWLWAGYGIRSSLECYRSLSENLKIEVIPLRLVDQRFYHLDTCLLALPGGRVVYYPPAFDQRSVMEIEQRVSSENRIEVSEQDAMQFACNAVYVDDTIVSNHASPQLQQKLSQWGYQVITTPLSEFMLAGGAAKCLCLYGNQDGVLSELSNVESQICQRSFQAEGHLLDSGMMNQVFDVITENGGTFQIEQFTVGQRHDQPSSIKLNVTAPKNECLSQISDLLNPLGVTGSADAVDADLVSVTQTGVAPQSFYSTSIYPTNVRVNGHWLRVCKQRMDAVIVYDAAREAELLRCVLIRDLKVGNQVVCGTEGVRVKRPRVKQTDNEFAFMSSGVSSERRVELAVEELAWEMRRIREQKGRIVFVAGPVVIHTGGGPYLAEIIRLGYVDSLLTGNALPTHDIEMNLYGTSLGIDLAHGVGKPGGHQHHIKAINQVRAAGSIQAAVEQGIVTDGVMFACVKNQVDYVLAGSIRDDGPLPDTIMDLEKAQAAYAQAIQGADLILMLSSMLHAIGTGNMTPAGVRLVCVDISPAVVTKLADRGSIESTGIVTDVGLFLNLLAAKLADQ
ncbi:MAG: TIGR00300 family protein [Blastopirellula sp.]|nr:MAG: TIGR00300 family protein [Blastopirellula sp.]